MNAPPSPQAGFTVVELLVVLAIIGLVLILTLPRLSNPARNAQLAAMQVAALINDASNLARTNEQGVAVFWNPVQRTFSLERLIPPTTPFAVDGYFAPMPGTPRVSVPPDVFIGNLPETGNSFLVQMINSLGRVTSGYDVVRLGSDATQAAVIPDATVVVKPDGAQVQVAQ